MGSNPPDDVLIISFLLESMGHSWHLLVSFKSYSQFSDMYIVVVSINYVKAERTGIGSELWASQDSGADGSTGLSLISSGNLDDIGSRLV